MFKLQKIKNKKKILKEAEEEKTPYIERKKDKTYNGLPFRNLPAGKNKTTNLKFCVQQNYSSKVKEN